MIWERTAPPQANTFVRINDIRSAWGAADLAQLKCTESGREPSERSARVDLGKLVVVADQDEL